MARKEPPLDQALAVVIDVVTRVSPYRWYTLRMDLDSLFQYPHDRGFVLGDMLDRLERSPELKGSPLPERALAVVIDAITSLPVERWISLRAQLDKVAQYPHKRDAVLKEMLCQLREPAHSTAPPRHALAPNVIALWPEDRPPVANPAGRGRYPRGVEALRRWHRLYPGAYCYLWNNCLPENRGLVVQLLGEAKTHNEQGMWKVRGITGMMQVGITTGTVTGPTLEGCASEVNLRRCPAPKGVSTA